MRDLTSVVVVAADSGPLLGGSIERALASSAQVEVVLVDNASSDGAVEEAVAAHRQDARLRLLRNPFNSGFGPACNRGAGAARGDALLFLNPDCMLERTTIAGLRAAAAAHPRVGLLGVNVRTPAGDPARGNRRREPSLRRALLTASGLSRFAPRWPALAGIEMPTSSAASGLESVEAVSGACMYVRREVFEQVGGFDEGYFLHVEDIDLCRRIRDVGFDVAIAHDLRVTHTQGTSSHHRAVFVSRHKHRGMWRYFVKFDPAARSVALRALVWSGIWLHFALDLPFARLRERRAGRKAPAN